MSYRDTQLLIDNHWVDAVDGKKGATLATGGRRVGASGYFFAPTVLCDVPLNASIFNDEPFGPVAAIRGFDLIEDAIAEANRLPSGLGVAAKKRTQSLPNIPTFDEMGMPGIYWTTWFGLMSPAGTPKGVVDRISAEVNAVLKDPSIQKRIAELGADVGGGTPDAFLSMLNSELKRFAEVVKSSGAKVD